MTNKKQTKLTLVVDPSIVRRAKSYASSHATSVSAIIEAYLKQLTESDRNDISTDPQSWPPLTRKLFGALHAAGSQGADYDSLRTKYLTEKHLHD